MSRRGTISATMKSIGKFAMAPCQATGRNYHMFTGNNCDDCHKTWYELWLDHDAREKLINPSPTKVPYTLKRRERT